MNKQHRLLVAACVLATTSLVHSAPIPMFVDDINDNIATVIVGDTTFNISTAKLAPNVAAGDWICNYELTLPPTSDAESIRHRLAADDDGADIKL